MDSASKLDGASSLCCSSPTAGWKSNSKRTYTVWQVELSFVSKNNNFSWSYKHDIDLWCHLDSDSEAPLTINEIAVIASAFKQDTCQSCTMYQSSARWRQRSVLALWFLALWETNQYIQLIVLHLHSLFKCFFFFSFHFKNAHICWLRGHHALQFICARTGLETCTICI